MPSDLTDVLLNTFRERGERVVYLPRQTLFRQDETFHHLFLLVNGLVQLIQTRINGQEVFAQLRVPGDLLGASTVILQKNAPTTAVTLTECDVYHLPIKAFLILMNKDIDVVRAVAYNISQQLYRQTARITRLSTPHSRSGLAAFLLEVAEGSNNTGECGFLLPYTKSIIAQSLAITPVHLSRLLREFKIAGIIQENRGKMFIRDISRLRELAET
jgi:CRP/FNR family transcriptional regulator, anaerobic regulatory protein